MYPQEQKILDRVNEGIRKGIRNKKDAQSNYASSLGHPCLRYSVFCRIRGEEARPTSLELQKIFDKGNHEQDFGVQLLKEKGGFKVIEQEVSLDWKKYNIRGYIDAKIEWDDNKRIPVEIKGYPSARYNKFNSIDDFFIKHDRPYMQAVPGQLMLYCLMSNIDEGFLYLVNKDNGDAKPIWLFLNSYLDYAESLIKKAETINKMVADKNVPDMITNELMCDGCDYEHICLPDRMLGKELTVLQDDPDVILKLERREELKKIKVEFDNLDKELKRKFENIENGVIGDYRIIGKKCHRDGYSVDATDYWQTSIKKLVIKK